MAEKISDDKFKAHVMQFIEVANQKFDGLTADVRTNAYKLDRFENGLNRAAEKLDLLENGLNRVAEKLDSVASDVKVLSGQFTDVAGVVIKNHHSRIERLEERVDLLESETH